MGAFLAASVDRFAALGENVRSILAQLARSCPAVGGLAGLPEAGCGAVRRRNCGRRCIGGQAQGSQRYEGTRAVFPAATVLGRSGARTADARQERGRRAVARVYDGAGRARCETCGLREVGRCSASRRAPEHEYGIVAPAAPDPVQVRADAELAIVMYQ